MMYSLITWLYSFYITLLGHLFTWVQPKQKITLLCSFPDNARAILNEISKGNFSFKADIFLTQHAVQLSNEFPSLQMKILNEKHPIHLAKAVFSMLASKVTIVDNYFVLCTVLKNRRSSECIQVWHANGALKKFGLEDITIHKRTASDKKRFNKVYQSFDKIVVGSDQMLKLFKEFFGVDDKVFLRTGIPLTDEYYGQQKNNEKSNRKHGMEHSKKMILYAPTFRDDQLSHVKLPFSEKELREDLNGEYILLVKLHPVIKTAASIPDNSPWIKDVTAKPLKEMLMLSDILISDYSSVPFEFALLNKPILFFTYDLEEYDRKRGLIDNYLTVIPGKACRDSQMLIEQLHDPALLKREVKQFSNEWNRYSDGNSTKRLFQYINEKMN